MGQTNRGHYFIINANVPAQDFVGVVKLTSESEQIVAHAQEGGKGQLTNINAFQQGSSKIYLPTTTTVRETGSLGSWCRTSALKAQR